MIVTEFICKYVLHIFMLYLKNIFLKEIIFFVIIPANR